jgi:SAM-dependent methyltransferase
VPPCLKLVDIVRRNPVPAPWEEGDNLPWDEPGFSRRMLAEHLSQAHDAASRRADRLDAHVRWIHSLLRRDRARILDLCCGPGLYTARLAALGHQCVGIDFAPAAIAYARRQARTDGLACRYVRADVRRTRCGTGFDLVTIIYGQFNVFRREDAAALLRQARAALAPRGLLLLEVHTRRCVERLGCRPAGWYSSPGGLFSPRAHLVLEEHFWDGSHRAATTRFHVLDAASGSVTRHALTTQAYAPAEYRALLRESGFAAVQRFPSLTGGADPGQQGLVVLVARAG